MSRPEIPTIRVNPAGSSWRADAECLDADPELFAARDLHTTAEWASIERTAELFCAACPVREECRLEAEVNRHIGLWGGVYEYVTQGRRNTRRYVDSRRVRVA